RPSAAEGHTIFIASDRGHLLPGVKAKRGSAWPDFKGTWELPARLPPASINPTARSEEGRQRLTHTYTHSHTHSGLDIHTHRAAKTTTTPAADGQTEEDQVRHTLSPLFPPPLLSPLPYFILSSPLLHNLLSSPLLYHLLSFMLSSLLSFPL
uniref:Protein Flattop n=1 Tax=Hucho hucho TaxID=62062 RepID=A0A4W5LK59_9TELE